MAATVTAVGTGTKEMDPYYVREFDVSTLVADENFDLTHGGPTQFKPDFVEFEWRTPPTALCVATPYRDFASDTTTTVRLRVVAAGGGDLTGAVLRVRCKWYGGKGGGISAA